MTKEKNNKHYYTMFMGKENMIALTEYREKLQPKSLGVVHLPTILFTQTSILCL